MRDVSTLRSGWIACAGLLVVMAWGCTSSGGGGGYAPGTGYLAPAVDAGGAQDASGGGSAGSGGGGGGGGSSCTPQCSGKACGPDGCGGQCGGCAGGEICDAGACKTMVTSCAGLCGVAFANATSYCDADCLQYGDCCADYEAQCGCKDECAVPTCAGGLVVDCVVGTDGCRKKLAPQACGGGLVCPAGELGCTACSNHGQCAETEVCTSLSSCTWAGGQTYEITIVSAKFSEIDPYGGAWDAFGGAPDPKICVYTAIGDTFSKMLGCTSMKSDTFSPFFLETIEGKISGLESLCVTAYDVDVSDDDNADGSCWENWIPLVKAGGYNGWLYDGFVQVDFGIAPKW